jgi:hypothetical protein
MKPPVGRAIAAVLCAGATLVVPAVPAAARPAHVGVVVQFAPGRVSRACTTADGSGLAVLARTFSVTIGHVPPYAGFVFTINGTGTTRPDDTHYWSYWRSAGNGEWSYSGSGAGSSTPAAGTVEGWSYVDGTANAAAPPPYSYASVCAGADPKPPPTRTSSRAYAPPPPRRVATRPAPKARSTVPTATPTAASGPRPHGTARPSPHHTPTPTRTSARATAQPVPSRTATTPAASTTAIPATPVVSPAAHRSHASGLPAWGTAIAVLVVLALGTGAWLRMRRRA